MIDFNELRLAIRQTFEASNPRMSPLYRLLRDELTQLGHWKGHPRGNPQKGYTAMKANVKRE